MIKVTVGDIILSGVAGRNEVDFYFKGKWMDKWTLGFNVESNEQLEKYLRKTIKNWNRIS